MRVLLNTWNAVECHLLTVYLTQIPWRPLQCMPEPLSTIVYSDYLLRIRPKHNKTLTVSTNEYHNINSIFLFFIDAKPFIMSPNEIYILQSLYNTANLQNPSSRVLEQWLNNGRI